MALGIEQVAYFNFNRPLAKKVLSNAAFHSILNPYENSIDAFTIATSKNPVLVSALHDLRSRIIENITASILSIIQETALL